MSTEAATADTRPELALDAVEVAAFTIPTDRPESDGTLEWEATTIVVVEAHAGNTTGVGYTYGDLATAALIDGTLAPLVTGMDALSVGRAFDAMTSVLRNAGRPGIGSMAIAAVETALFDLKARLLEVPLATLLGGRRRRIRVYGSGGFTSYSVEQLQAQLGAWAAGGIHAVKMKVGREPARDVDRVRAAREAVGADVELFVDANGALSRKQALALAERFAESDVRWFEEPVSSEDVDGLRLLRDRAPAGMDVAAGEYCYVLPDFERLLAAGAIDCLQADATRCEGYTGFLRAAVLCDAHSLEMSAHTAPALHTHVCSAAPRVRHVEYFHDHVRVEQMLFDGIPELVDGALEPDLTRPGNGLELRRSDARRFRSCGELRRHG